MTLIITRASFRSVIQVSDRLITRNATPYDELANKTVLFLARNGLVTISYTGLAYVERVPTDQWIAQVLSGESYEQFAKPPAFMMRPSPNKIDIGSALSNLKIELGAVAGRLQNNRRRRTWTSKPLYLSIAGWQWNSRGHYRPLLAGIEKSKGSNSANLSYAERRWYIGRQVSVTDVPPGHIASSDLGALRSSLPSADPNRCEQLMSEAIRKVSRTSPLVGAHVMSIRLPPPPVYRWARVSYISPHQFNVKVVGKQSSQCLTAVFSPWIVGPQMVHAPSIIAGSTKAQLGWLEIQIHYPYPRQRLAVVAGQRRKPEPP